MYTYIHIHSYSMCIRVGVCVHACVKTFGFETEQLTSVSLDIQQFRFRHMTTIRCYGTFQIRYYTIVSNFDENLCQFHGLLRFYTVTHCSYRIFLYLYINVAKYIVMYTQHVQIKKHQQNEHVKCTFIRFTLCT